MTTHNLFDDSSTQNYPSTVTELRDQVPKRTKRYKVLTVPEDLTDYWVVSQCHKVNRRESDFTVEPYRGRLTLVKPSENKVGERERSETPKGLCTLHQTPTTFNSGSFSSEYGI